MDEVITLPPFASGKVRDTFEIPTHPDKLLMVASNRASTHNVVHESTVPFKGQVLTAMTVFWTQNVLRGLPHHIQAYGKDIYSYLPRGTYPEDLHLRALVVKKLTVVPYEFVWRERLAGSLWKSYSAGEENPYGISLPPEMQLMQEFEEPIFTPTEKSKTDDPVFATEVGNAFPCSTRLTQEAYRRGREHARACGIEIIDTKFEIGLDENKDPHLADEFMTPDSSRFVLVKDVELGKEPPWLDKQVLRREAESIWNSGPREPLVFSEGVVKQTMLTYLGLLERMTGMGLHMFQLRHMGG